MLFHIDKSTGARLEDHSSIRKLRTILDLQHTCGYLTLLKTGKVYNTKNKDSNHSATNSSRESTPEHGIPKNGLKDRTSAEILATEVDSVLKPDNSGTSPKKTVAEMKAQMRLDMTNKNVSEDRGFESHWVLLDCNFGIPLFNARINRDVFERIEGQNLCSKER